MNTYMVSITMPDQKDSEFLSLIPRERQHIDGLMERNVVLTYTLSADRTRLWTTINAESLDSAHEIVNEFPLRKFMAVEIFELTFHNTAAIRMPTLSMN